jgi:hypothetical protein
MEKEEKVFGPNIYGRDEHGLLKGVEYVFREDGTVDWRKMIPEEFIVINDDYFINKHKPVPESLDGIGDEGLLILLGGIKELAKIRGFIRKNTKVVHSSEGRAVCECTITFIPNYESHGEEFVYSSVASATFENVSSIIGKYYLETIAENRAFVRAVRNALRVDAVGADEVSAVGTSSPKSEGKTEEYSHGAKPYEALADLAGRKGYGTIDEFKIKLLSKSGDKFVYNHVESLSEEIVGSWDNWSDIDQDFVYQLLALLNTAKKKDKSKK